MTNPLVQVETLLAVDVGALNTRALLFDVSEGHYRFVAAGQAPSTAGAPFRDVREGVSQALKRLQEITGRILTSEGELLILPSLPDGSGVDAMTLTISAGPPLNAVIVGLLPGVSLESARRLAATTYAKIVEALSLDDHRKSDEQMDAIIHTQPDVVIIAGGTDGGAARSLTRMTEVVGLASYLIPAEKRPVVLYAGNQKISDEVQSQFTSITPVHISPNIRPSHDQEHLAQAQDKLAQITLQNRAAQIGGIAELGNLSGGHALTTAQAFGRMICFLSKVYDPAKGVLGIDLGASSTTLAAAYAGKLDLVVRSQFGISTGLPGVLQEISLEEVLRWLPFEVPIETVRDYLHNKIIFPASLAVTPEDNAIEQAMARCILAHSMNGLLPSPSGALVADGGVLTMHFEPIIATGAVLSQGSTPGQSLLMLLDGLQPTGVTTFILDQNALTSSLGAAAEISSLLPVQVLESGVFVNLGTVVSPVSRARPGTPILKTRLVYEDGTDSQTEVNQGAFHILPLARGQNAELYLEPLNGTDIGMDRPGSGIKIVGGALGAVIDARGRPLNLPPDDLLRREALKKWLWTVGG